MRWFPAENCRQETNPKRLYRARGTAVLLRPITNMYRHRRHALIHSRQHLFVNRRHAQERPEKHAHLSIVPSIYRGIIETL